MGVLQAATKEITLTALGFGLAASSHNNLTRSLLYDIEPSALRSLVVESQDTFRKSVKDTVYNDKATTIRVLQAYLSTCLPATLEAEINKSVANVKFDIKEVDEEQKISNFVPRLVQKERVEYITKTRGVKKYYEEMLKILDKEKQKNNKKFKDCVNKLKLSDCITTKAFLSDNNYNEEREKFFECLEK